MKIKRFSKAMACVLSACMILSSFTVVASAASDYKSETHDVFKHTESTLAPGVEQSINYAYAKDGEQMVYYVATADIGRDDVEVHSSYKDAQCTEFGMDKLTNQMAAADAKYTNTDYEHYNPYFKSVAGVNGDFYNMQTGRPSGAFVMDGIMSSSKANNRPFFAIMEDGIALCGANNAQWDAAVTEHGKVMEAVGGSQMLVVDGKDVTASATGSYNTDRHSRTMVGVTSDGKVVMTVVDGRQEPFSCGGNMHELAQIMLEQGCVSAINLDGGGSTTYAARQEGESEVKVVNRPSDGSERSISSGLLIASTAVPSDTFDHAVITPENDYVTPGSTVNINAVGVSPAGTSAEIPENVTYSASLGIVENGKFISNGTAGEAKVQMLLDDNVVGETTIHVVVPDKLIFDSETITVPFGKTVEISMTATYGLNKVSLKPNDVNFSLEDNSVGLIDGFNFTAAEENSVTSSAVTATLAFDKDITAVSTINLGRGSEVALAFDSEEVLDRLTWSCENGHNYNNLIDVDFVTSETGRVHDGETGLVAHVDFSQTTDFGGCQGVMISNSAEPISIDGAAGIGCWVYVPEEDNVCRVRMLISTASGSIITTTNMNQGFSSVLDEGGWHYLYCDLSNVDTSGAYIRGGGSPFIQFEQFYSAYPKKSINTKTDWYIGDITVDYSSAVNDRALPVFGNIVLQENGIADYEKAMTRDVIAESNAEKVSFSAAVADNTLNAAGMGEATGIDAASAVAYIDGNKVECNYSNGKINIPDLKLASGVHTVKFGICDKAGNYASAIRQVKINSNGNISTIKLVPHDPDADKILIGSIYYVDVVATMPETIKETDMVLDLNNVSTWELDHMNVAKGFKAEYTVKEENNLVNLHIERVGNTDGSNVLASIPVRTWVSDAPLYYGGRTGKEPTQHTKQWTVGKAWDSKTLWPMDITVEVEYGHITYSDDYSTDALAVFSGQQLQVDTEIYYSSLNLDTADWNSKKGVGWHTHTANAIDDKTATCTEDGYTGRTYCEVCKSVVEWGTTIPATGHTYEIADSVLKCKDCDELYNGEYEGKFYVDGVPANGWVEDSYYADGKKLTGIQNVDGYYYNFGDDGISTGKYTGFIEKDEGWYYSAIGKLAKGWMNIDNDYYYFDPETGLSYYGKKYYINQQSYEFDEKGKVVKGLWDVSDKGTKYFYGPSCYTRTWAEIDGKTYYFDVNGYRKEGTCWFIAGSSNNPPKWYEFTNEGVLVREFDETGLFTFDGSTYYLKNGVNQLGLIEVDGNYYYFRSTDYTAVKGRYWVGNTNGLDFEEGYYNFADDGKMIIKTEEPTTKPDEAKNGIFNEDGTLYYYVNGEKNYAGLFELNENYYYANSYGIISTGRYWISKTNDIMPAGFYDFADDGKMIIKTEEPTTKPDETKNGIFKEDGTLYYYVKGEKNYAGLFELDGNYYYANSYGIISTGRYWISKTNDIMPAGFYDFADDGKMIIK